jgi:hypothetical protein
MFHIGREAVFDWAVLQADSTGATDGSESSSDGVTGQAENVSSAAAKAKG